MSEKLASRTSTESIGSSIGSRVVGAAALVAIAVIHVVDLPDKMEETPYLGWMYVGLIVASLALAGLLISGRRTREAWTASALLAGATFVGFCLSRTTGLPGSHEDVGNWSEPLGTVSLITEGMLVLLAGALMGRTGRSRSVQPRIGVRLDQESGA